MRKEIIRKTLVCIITVLFIGSMVLPAITANDFGEDTLSKEPNCNGQVEIIVELWKPCDVQIYPVYLTEEEYSQLIILTENFKMDLNSAVTYDIIVAIYVNMIISLYELGLFDDVINLNLNQYTSAGNIYESEYTNYDYNYAEPEGPSESLTTQEQKITMINQAILLLDELGLSPLVIINKENQNLLAENNLNADDLLNLKPYDGNSIDVCENLLCLTSGNPNNIHFYSGNDVFLEALYKFYYKLVEWAQNQDFLEYLNLDVETLLEIPDAINYLLGLFSLQIQIPVGHIIGFGSEGRQSANGWVHTLGLNGIQAMEGDFYGQITLPEDIGSDINYLGSIGFTGIRINPIGFYLGAALWVKIGLNLPGSGDNPDTPVVQDTQTSIPDNQVSESDQIPQENPEQNIPEDIPTQTPDEPNNQNNNKPDKNRKPPKKS